MLKVAIGIGITGFFVCAVILILRWMFAQAAARQRWSDWSGPAASGRAGDGTIGRSAIPDRGLAYWLYLSGYRDRWAPAVFLATTATGFLFGLTAAVGLIVSGLQALMEVALLRVPGGVGETFLPAVWIAPWFALLLLTCGPWLVVRQARRQRVLQVEQDLPLILELLSTLSEAGLGFDAALTRILKTRLQGRPLANELQLFQSDLLAGHARVDALRRLSKRLQVTSISVLVSALVQAEQLGMGIARVLRQQAEEVRVRRRERAIAFANSLPTKRVVPLVICFLPGLFVWTLGPAFVQLFKLVDSFIQVQNF